MKTQLLMSVAFINTVVISTSFAYPQAQSAAKIIQDKAISYAIQADKTPNFDIKAASRELSQNALDLGKIYGSSYTLKLNDITAEQCQEEVTQLGVDSANFIDKALAHEYKIIATVNGNQVMLIAGSAGQLTYIVINQGKFCTIDKSIHDAYWAANIIRLGIDGLDVAFS